VESEYHLPDKIIGKVFGVRSTCVQRDSRKIPSENSLNQLSYNKDGTNSIIQFQKVSVTFAVLLAVCQAW
jgi:hypothetical protein